MSEQSLRRLRIGIDLGGSKIEAIALDPAGNEVLRRRIVTPGDDYDAILTEITLLVHRLESQLNGRGSIGIGTPGATSPTSGLLRNSNTTVLNGRPFQADLEARLGRRIRIANDANCFALSEAVDGAGKGAEVVFGVIIGTGTGAGVVVGGRPLVGPNAIAGEWGHNPLPWPRDDELPGPRCYCGRAGCVETWLSGPGLQADHHRVNGISLTAAEIATSALAGDPSATVTLERYCDRMARALASVINILDPTLIVLGGGLSNIEQLYDAVPSLWRQYVFSDSVTTPLVRASHGDSSGVRGAAWLWPAEETVDIRI